MFTSGVTTFDSGSSSSNKYKTEKTKEKSDETTEMDLDHQTLLSDVVLN
jgi:hypothetical protein